ncbi:protein unc-93 homolog A-like [Liolophura sinensis]|uniref:protein unc-93 homolog A-like n=1 Tax=Liolophura sinensis TaxID=3198878 RepID=UPI003158436D
MPANATMCYAHPGGYGEQNSLLRHKDAPSVNSTKIDICESSHREVTPGKCILNSVAMALVYFLAFSGFAALRNLESSIDRLAEIRCLYVTVGSLHHRRKGIGGGDVDVYGVAGGSKLLPGQLYAVSGAALFGFMAGPGWTAQLSYTTNTAIKYAQLKAKDEEHMVEVSNGIFYLGYSSAQVVGNLISSLILENNNSNVKHNLSQQSQCGVNFCPVVNPVAPSPEASVPENTLHGLFGIFLAGPVLALLVSGLLLDPVRQFFVVNHGDGSRGCGRWRDELMAPLKLFKDVRMVLLVPAILYSGIEQILMFASFNEAFVSCAIGVDYVGFIMICWGVASAGSSFLSGILARCFGRCFLCVSSLVMGLGLQMYFLFWRLTGSRVIVYFAVSATWGVADGLLQTQLSSLLGLVFKENHNPAFANFRMLSYFGYAVTYAATAVMCQATEIYITSGIICLSIVSYIFLEIFLRRRGESRLLLYQSL